MFSTFDLCLLLHVIRLAGWLKRCKLAVWRPYSYGLIDRIYDRNLIPNAKCGKFG